MLRRAAILKRICDRRRAQNAQKMKCNIIIFYNDTEMEEKAL